MAGDVGQGPGQGVNGWGRSRGEFWHPCTGVGEDTTGTCVALCTHPRVCPAGATAPPAQPGRAPPRCAAPGAGPGRALRRGGRAGGPGPGCRRFRIPEYQHLLAAGASRRWQVWSFTAIPGTDVLVLTPLRWSLAARAGEGAARQPPVRREPLPTRPAPAAAPGTTDTPPPPPRAPSRPPMAENRGKPPLLSPHPQSPGTPRPLEPGRPGRRWHRCRFQSAASAQRREPPVFMVSAILAEICL